ncbi:MAG: polysulfide reductase NrfD [Magnetococcales bacterium]|nr:polysulfide reductase NrfD [Magnetococcales bacterium]
MWMIGLVGVFFWGLVGYRQQWQRGLAVTALSDQTPWGLYIANFLFLVGIAASAVVLLAAVQLFHRQDLSPTLLPAKALAITAVLMSLLFVTADLGHPERIWHALPLLGSLNFPTSILAWDILALSAYLLLNMGLVWRQSRTMTPSAPPSQHTVGMGSILAIVLGLSIHTITAFMLAGTPSRPMWFNPLLAPRFIVSAFAAGSALMIILFLILNRWGVFSLPQSAIRFLSQVLTATLLIHLFLLGVESFSHVYPVVHQGGVDHHATPWTLWTQVAIGLSVLATLIMIYPRWRMNRQMVAIACGFALTGIWMEKGLGLVIAGLNPTPLGEWVVYIPSAVEIQISLGIWAFGALLLTELLRWIVRHRS